MAIYVDADACPVKDEVYKVARRLGLLPACPTTLELDARCSYVGTFVTGMTAMVAVSARDLSLRQTSGLLRPVGLG